MNINKGKIYCSLNFIEFFKSMNFTEEELVNVTEF